MPTTDRYQLLDVLGQGGMAVVYRAYDTRLRREIAFKVLAAHLITESAFYQRFEREARTIATLEHPSIVPVYDFGIDENKQPYLVMRLLRGGTLRDRRARGELAGADLWPPMHQVAAALDYAHSANVVHRDIKPVNILFDEKGNAYVSDFGIAKVRDTTTGDLTGNNVLGTPAYMSPEQFEGRPVDGRCDQYSLAVVLFEALTGRVPFAGKTPGVLMNQHLNNAPTAAHTLNPKLPPAVSAVLNRALAKNTAARYPTVSAFVQELEAASYQTAPPAHAPRPAAERRAAATGRLLPRRGRGLRPRRLGHGGGLAGARHGHRRGLPRRRPTAADGHAALAGEARHTRPTAPLAAPDARPQRRRRHAGDAAARTGRAAQRPPVDRSGHRPVAAGRAAGLRLLAAAGAAGNGRHGRGDRSRSHGRADGRHGGCRSAGRRRRPGCGRHRCRRRRHRALWRRDDAAGGGREPLAGRLPPAASDGR
ncbi:MAG: serine/threonine protein kinase [Candidatus Promineofilum sp.]|nr:serine/threonine protein kinase [Promineifilum sp.]